MDAKTRENNRIRQRRFLELHKDEVNDKRREKYQERISSGKCPRCGGRTRKGRTLCTKCCEYMLDLNRKYAKQNKTAVKAKPAVKAKTTAKAKPVAKAKPAVKAKTVVKAKTAVKPKTTTARKKSK